MTEYTAQEIRAFFVRQRFGSLMSRLDFKRPRHDLTRNEGIAAVCAPLAEGLTAAAKAEPRHEVPRHIYTLWQQGWDKAPPLVQACAQSWQDQNPGWTVHRLDDEQVAGLVPELAEFDHVRMGRAGQSDLVRMALIRKFGGLWVDATTWCARPLDDWLPGLMQSDFFTFSRPRAHRAVASWFIAAPAESQTMEAWWDLVVQNWRLFDKPHHYFWLHYLFEYLTTRDSAVMQSWQAMPKLPARPSFVVATSFDRGRVADAAWKLVEDNLVPVHKFNHRWPAGTDISGTPLGQLTGLAAL